MFTRRDLLKSTAAIAAAAAGTGPGLPSAPPAEAAEPVFKVPPLGYGFDALEPYIDTTTMMIHHDRHHGAYVAAANGLVEKYPDLAVKPPAHILSDLTIVPEAVRQPVRNNLGGHWNHSFFWELMKRGGAKEPGGELKAAIDTAFDSTGKLIEKVNAAGLGRFGSGWAWLVVDKKGKLDILSTPPRIRRSNWECSESCLASMSGNMPIISNIKTSAPTISWLGGTRSIGTRPRQILPKHLSD